MEFSFGLDLFNTYVEYQILPNPLIMNTMFCTMYSWLSWDAMDSTYSEHCFVLNREYIVGWDAMNPTYSENIWMHRPVNDKQIGMLTNSCVIIVMQRYGQMKIYTK